jgi:hypothetical protein
MGKHGLEMIEKVHEGNDENSLHGHKHHKAQKTLHELPKLWPPIIMKH